MQKQMTINIPETRHDMVEGLGEALRDMDYAQEVIDKARSEYLQWYCYELMQCLEYAQHAQGDPVIYFTCATRQGKQIIAEFEVRDLAKPRNDSYNWHGQNTSQWIYAGAIVCHCYDDEVMVQTHH